MKIMICILSALAMNSANASGVTAPSYTGAVASYLVPTTEKELETLSSFDVQINTPYQGSQTQSISYTFPPELTGNPALTVSMNRVAGTNNWAGPAMTATCDELNTVFTCQMNFVKDENGVLTGAVIDKENIRQVLKDKLLPDFEIEQRLRVVDQFLLSEPAGVLTYVFSAK